MSQFISWGIIHAREYVCACGRVAPPRGTLADRLINLIGSLGGVLRARRVQRGARTSTRGLMYARRSSTRRGAACTGHGTSTGRAHAVRCHASLVGGSTFLCKGWSLLLKVIERKTR
jgi:hypothetical protein